MPALEIVLTVAYREATSRRHTHLTLEHLLYALAHDLDGERILAACGADLPQLRKDLDKYLKESVEQFSPRPAEGAGADARVPPRAADGGAARAERRPPGSAVGRRARRDAAAEQVVRGAAARRAGHDAARRARVHHARHQQGAAGRRRPATTDDDPDDAEAGFGERGTGDLARSARRLRDESDRARARRRARSADRPHATSCSGRWRSSAAAGRTIRCSSATPASARPRSPKGWRRACSATTCPSCSKGAEVFSLDTGALLAGTRFRGDFEERFKAVISALVEAADADSLHRRDPLDGRRRRDDRRHDGSRDADQADPDRRPAARRRFDDARGVQAHREGPRAGAPAAEDHHRRAVDPRDGEDPRRACARATRRTTA